MADGEPTPAKRSRAAPKQAFDGVGKAAKSAAGGVASFSKATNGAATAVDKLIGKKAALKDVLGGGLGNVANAARAAGGPLGKMAEKIDAFSAIAGRVPPQVAAIIIAITVLAAVASAGAAALYKMGEAAVQVISQRMALLNTFAALSWGNTGGKATLAAVDALAAKLPIARDKIAEWATEFQKVNLQGRDLENAIKAVAAATAIMGEKGGAAAQEMIYTFAKGGAEATQLIAKLKNGLPEGREMLAQMGLRVEDLADALGVTVMQFKRMRLSARQAAEAVEKALAKKGAGPLVDLALTFPVLIAKLKEGLLSLFDKLGPSVKPFMKAVKALFGEFSKGGGALKALKPAVTAVMSTVFQWATKAVQAVHNLIGGFMGSKKATGPFASIGAALRKIWDSASGLFKVLMKALGGGGKGASGFAMSLKVLAIAVEIVAEFVSDLFNQIALGVAFFNNLVEMVNSAMSALSGLGDSASSAGQAIIDGLLSFDPGAFVSKMIDMAKSGLAAFKSVLGISSPSKVMAQMTGYVGDGAVQGLDRSASKVEDSAASLGKGVAGGAAKGMSGAGGKGGAKGGLTINGGVNITVPHGTPSAWAEEAFAAFMERVAASQGVT